MDRPARKQHYSEKGFDEMQRAKRDEIGHRMYRYTMGVILIVAVLYFFFNIAVNLLVVIGAIAFISWNVYNIWLTKRGVIAPNDYKPQKIFWTVFQIAVVLLLAFQHILDSRFRSDNANVFFIIIFASNTLIFTAMDITARLRRRQKEDNE